MIEDTRLRLLSALGEHDADCMLCRVEAALAHAEEGGVKGGIEPSYPLPPGVCIWNGGGLYAACICRGNDLPRLRWARTRTGLPREQVRLLRRDGPCPQRSQMSPVRMTGQLRTH